MNNFLKSLAVSLISLIGGEIIGSDTTSFWDEGSIPYRYTYKKNSKGKSIRDQNEFLRFAIKNDSIKKCKNPFKSWISYQKKANINYPTHKLKDENLSEVKQISHKYLTNGLFNPFILDDLLRDIPSNITPITLLDIVSDPIISLFKNKTEQVPLLDLFKNFDENK